MTEVCRATVVIPTFNRADLLTRALESLEAQTRSDLEIVVVDDGSTDDTLERLGRRCRNPGHSRHPPRIRVISQSRRGAPAARNRGAAAARGEVLAFLDSDDAVEPRWLEELLPVFGSPEVALAFCGARFFDRRGVLVREQLPDRLGPLFNDWRGHFNDGAFWVRRDVFETVGGYEERLAANQHTELGFRLVDHCDRHQLRGVCIEKPLVRYHSHQGPSIRSDSLAVLRGSRWLLDRYAERLRRHPDTYVEYLAIAGISAARLGRHREARDLFRQAIREKPGDPKAYLRWLATLSRRVSARLWGP